MQTIYYLSVRMQPCSYHVSLSGFVRRLLRSGLRIVGSLETDVARDRGGPWRRVYWGGAGWGSCWHCWSARRGREPDIRCIHAAEYGSRYYNITQSGRRGFFLNIKMLKYVHSEGKVTFFSWNEIFCFNIQYLFGTYERMRELKVGNKIKRTVRYISVLIFDTSLHSRCCKHRNAGHRILLGQAEHDLWKWNIYWVKNLTFSIFHLQLVHIAI